MCISCLNAIIWRLRVPNCMKIIWCTFYLHNRYIYFLLFPISSYKSHVQYSISWNPSIPTTTVSYFLDWRSSSYLFLHGNTLIALYVHTKLLLFVTNNDSLHIHSLRGCQFLQLIIKRMVECLYIGPISLTRITHSHLYGHLVRWY